MDAEMEISTINFEDVDFLTNEIDDCTLSQVCDVMEKEEIAFEGMEKLSISQMFQEYDVDLSLDGLTQNCFDEQETLDVKMDFDIMSEEEKSKFLVLEDKKRFADRASDEDAKELLSNQENKNTKKNTSWAIRVFEMWRENRNSVDSENYIREFTNMTSEEMNYYLGKFVVETRKQDGEPYPPRSLYLLVCGLLRYLRDESVFDKNFLDTNNSVFHEFRKILDARMKELLSLGYGTKIKQAEPILPEDESVLWEKGVFGDSNAEMLQSTVFFYACKLFALRGHDEHHDLQCEQFTVGSDKGGKFVQFAGRNNKTYKGGLKDLELSNKSIRHYCQEGPRCIADYFHKYLDALGNRGHFYRRPLAGTPPRFGEQLVGVNKLKNLMKIICKRGGLEGNYSNHSGKRTCATQLYMAGVDEQEIMSRTGHRSERSVRKYKQSNIDIQKKVASVLDPPAGRKRKCSDSENDDASNDNPVSNVKKEKRSSLMDVTNGSYFANCQISFNFK